MNGMRLASLVCAATFPLGAFAEAADEAVLSCLQSKFEIVSVRYQVRGVGFPEIVAEVRNGLDWPAKGFSIDYVVHDPSTGEDVLTWSSSEALDDPIDVGETRVVTSASVYLEDVLGRDAAKAAEIAETLTVTAVLRDVMDADERQVLKNGVITMTGWKNPVSERKCS